MPAADDTQLRDQARTLSAPEQLNREHTISFFRERHGLYG